MRKLPSCFKLSHSVDILLCLQYVPISHGMSLHHTTVSTCRQTTFRTLQHNGGLCISDASGVCVFPGGLLSAVCGGLPWSRPLGAALWCRAAAGEHQEAAAVTVWAAGGFGLRHQEHRWGVGHMNTEFTEHDAWQVIYRRKVIRHKVESYLALKLFIVTV